MCRWKTKRRVALVVRVLNGETSVAKVARKHGLTVAEIEDCPERLVLGAGNALWTRPRDDDALKDEQIKKLRRRIGELVLDIDVLRELVKARPSGPTTSGE